MQDSHDFDACGSNAIEDDVPAFVITIRGANDLIAFFSPLRLVSKIGKSILKLFDVVEALLSSPFLVRVAADISQVCAGFGGDQEFLHDLASV